MQADRLKIAITGYPGTGKTSLAKALGEKYGLPVIQEGMRSIVNVDRAYYIARSQGRNKDLPFLKEQVVKSFLEWDSSRSIEYGKHKGFIADRWEADLIEWWLFRFGVGKNDVDDDTKRLLKNFKKKSKLFDCVLMMPLEPPFSEHMDKNDDGLKRKIDFTTQIMSYSMSRGLIQSFTQMNVIYLPKGKTSVRERVDFVDDRIANRTTGLPLDRFGESRANPD